MNMLIYLPEYVKKDLDRLQYPKPKKPQYSPHRWTVPTYVKRLQMTLDPENSEPLDKKPTKIIQSIAGTIICYARSVDTTILQAINEISRVQ